MTGRDPYNSATPCGLRETDFIDFAPVEVTESPAAEESHRIYMDRQQRESLWEMERRVVR